MNPQPEDTDLALAIDGAADAVKERWKIEYMKQPRNQKQCDSLEQEYLTLQSLAMRMRTLEISKLIAGADTSITELKQVTKKAAQAVQALDDVRKAIKVATAVLGLAAAITASVVAPNPATITAALKALKNVVDTAQARPKAKAMAG